MPSLVSLHYALFDLFSWLGPSPSASSMLLSYVPEMHAMTLCTVAHICTSEKMWHVWLWR